MPVSLTSVARTFVVLSALALITSCTDTSPTDPIDHAAMHNSASAGGPGGGNSVAAAGLAKVVHASASRYHATAQARKDGYVADPICVALPGTGGMGVHWANGPLIDPVFEATRPEVVLYAPDSNGKSRLVAVEYVVIDVGQPAPTFAGHPFDVGGVPPLMQAGIPHWSLHVWLFEENPTGMFMRWNPNVACPAP